MSKDVKRLYRPEKDRVIGGVASGLGVYLGIDPAIVRVIIALLFLAGGFSLLLYLLLWLIIPTESSLDGYASKKVISDNSKEMEKTAHEYADKVEEAIDLPGSEKWIGSLLLIAGVLLLLRNLGVFIWFSLSKLWPLLVIVIGFKLLLKDR